MQVSVPLIADKSETENVQVKATVKDVGLYEMQGSGGLGGVEPETIHVKGSEGVGGVRSETMHVGGSEVRRDVGHDNVAAGGNEGVTDARPKIVRDVGPKIVVDAGSEGVRDAGAQNVEYDEVEPDIMQNLPNTEETVAGSESSDDLVRGVRSEDSEEERALGADDGFMHPEVGQVEVELNDKVRMMKEKQAGNIRSPVKEKGGETSGRGCRCGRSGRSGRGGGQNRAQNDGGNVEGFAPPDMENMHIMEEDYETEELHSDAESSDGEGGIKPRYPRFHKEDKCKQFK
ncbi:hypothetical protein SESBI_01880 [Sesbania bispinosa]|nr:hypothetical protein SESBI_01880 [Sesbania bispinosa]